MTAGHPDGLDAPDGPGGADGADGADGPPDPRLARLLRWYPRTWRERYGEEFLAMVEDTLGSRRPGWRLHLDVIRAGLRERARRSVPAVLRRMTADADPPPPLGRAGLALTPVSLVLFWSVQAFTWAPTPPENYDKARGAVAAGAMVGLCVVVGVTVITGALAAGPAFVRFLRAGGWPEIRRQVALAAGLTAVAVAALTRLLLVARSITWEQLPGSVAYMTWFVAALVPLGAALLLWRKAAITVAGRLDLRPGVRAVQVMLTAVATIAAEAMSAVLPIWIGQARSDAVLLSAGLVLLVVRSRPAPARLWQAWHRARQLRAGAAGSGPDQAAE